MRKTLLVAAVALVALAGLALASLQFLGEQPQAPKASFPPAATRDEAWRQDIAYLRKDFAKLDRSFTSRTRKEFRRRLDRLDEAVPSLTDNQMIAGISRAVAASGNAHTRTYLLRNASYLRRLPIRFYWFADGLYVIRATEDHAELLGARVLALHGTPPEQLRREIGAYVSGTDSWVTYMSTYYLDSPDFLNGIGVVADPESVPITFQRGGEAPFQRTLAPLPLDERKSPYEAWRDLSPVATGNEDGHPWMHLLPAEDLPLYLRQPNRAWTYEYLEGDRTLYIQLTRNTGDENASQEDLAAALKVLADSIAPAAVVFDVRFNTGGDFTQTGTITKEIPRWFQSARRVYIVTGPPTFSAGIVSAARLKHFSGGKALVLGEPAGDGLTMWSEGPTCTLPNSKLRVKAATAFHDFKTGRFVPGKTYMVDLFYSVPAGNLDVDWPVAPTFEEYRAGRDPVLERVLQAVREGSGAST